LRIDFYSECARPPTQKIGYAESDYILSLLPEFKKIESELKTHGAQLENQMKAKYDDYQAKLKAYKGCLQQLRMPSRRTKKENLPRYKRTCKSSNRMRILLSRKKQADLMDPITKNWKKQLRK